MNKPALLFRFLKGSRLTYFAAIVAVVGNVAISTLIPMIIKNTIDSIFGSEALALTRYRQSIQKRTLPSEKRCEKEQRKQQP